MLLHPMRGLLRMLLLYPPLDMLLLYALFDMLLRLLWSLHLALRHKLLLVLPALVWWLLGLQVV
jgi:hypothetical protein